MRNVSLKSVMVLAIMLVGSLNVKSQVTYCESFGTATADGARSWASTSIGGAGSSTSVAVGISNGSAAGVIYRGIKNTTPIDVVAGQSMTIASTGGFNWVYCFTYADWNADGDFEDAGESLSKLPAASSSFNADATGSAQTRTSTTTVPADATIGNTRVRVIFCWWSDAEPVTPCSVASLTNNAMVCDFLINVLSATLPNSRTVSVSTSNAAMGTAVITGTTDVTTLSNARSVSVMATPATGYFFSKWTNALTGDSITTTNPYVYPGTGDITLKANFIPGYYPVMKRFYNGSSPATQQADRYITSATATVNGTAYPIVSGVSTNPNPIGSVASNAVVANATVDYRTTQIVVPAGTNSFDFLCTGSSATIENLKWTQQNAFIDWNRDFDFLDTNEAGARSSSASSNAALVTGYTRTISIPTGQAAGIYRMRVIYNEPVTAATDWSTSIWSNNTIRNGVAFDFEIRYGDVTTSVAANAAEKFQIRVNEGVVSVLGLKDFEVYSVIGQKQNVKSVLKSGVYVLKANGCSQKFVVR